MIELSKDIDLAKKWLEAEQVVAIPTETVYGLAGNIYSEKAIRTIFETKKRPFYNPLIVHIHSANQLTDLAEKLPVKAEQLAAAFWPGSLTLVLKKKDSVSQLITGGKDTVAIRIPNHPLTLELLAKLDFPLAAPSANPFGSISPTTAQHVADYFPETLPMVLDGGECMNGIESTIIGFENDVPVLYRLGAISKEEIEQVIGPITIKNHSKITSSTTEAPEAPGMLTKHYAPKTKLILTDDVIATSKKYELQQVGFLLFQDIEVTHSSNTKEILSEKGSYKEAASNLYAAMHRLDQLQLDVIIAQKFPDIDLGKSINDRLERATKN